MIADFRHGQAEKIDLSAIGPAGGLEFIGDDAFTAVGQVQAVKCDGITLVRVNIVGCASEEMKIEVTASMTLHANSFLF